MARGQLVSMNSSELKARCALVRERFAAIGGVLDCGQVAKALGVYCAGHPDVNRRTGRPMKAGASLKRTGWKGYPDSNAPFGPMSARHQVEWVKTPDAKPAKMLGTKRGKRMSPLVTIAAQAPKKLRKRYASAEAMLAANIVSLP